MYLHNTLGLLFYVNPKSNSALPIFFRMFVTGNYFLTIGSQYNYTCEGWRTTIVVVHFFIFFG